MSQLGRTHDHGPEFDLSLQAVLGLAWLLSQVEAVRPESETPGPRAKAYASSSSSCDHDPVSLALLGVIAVACKLGPIVEGLRTASPRRLPIGVHGEGRVENNRNEAEVRGGAHRKPGELDGLLR